MANMLHRKIPVTNSFDVSKVVTTRLKTRKMKTAKKFEDVKLQALLNEDDSQTQKQLAEQLGVSQRAVFNRLREMGKDSEDR